MSKEYYEFPLSPPADSRTPQASAGPSVTPEPPDMASLPTPSTTSISPHQRPALALTRRDRNPPRNTAGAIICEHPDCQDSKLSFRRPCEWNKHMDRHERPYKCYELGCESTQGFTYSGGLLRHQREVHKMHQSGKDLLYCPFENCVRATGEGFTRKENLEEHKRRRHQSELAETSPVTMNGSPTRKRKRLLTPQPDALHYENHSLQNGDDDEEEIINHPVFKRYMSQKDTIIQHQHQEIFRLQSILRNIPAQAIFNVSPMVQQNHLQRQSSQSMT